MKSIYVITLKKNQGNLYDEVEKLFNLGISTGFEGIEHIYHSINFYNYLCHFEIFLSFY